MLTALLLSACTSAPAAAPPPPPPPVVEVVAAPPAPPPPAWPLAGAPLTSPVAEWPADSSFTVYVDGGHGAEGNSGMQGVTCEYEKDMTLRYADELVARIDDIPQLKVTESRRDGNVGYTERIRAAEALQADLMLSLHVDSRAVEGDNDAIDAETGCWGNTGGEGFAVLWSDEGAPELVEKRHTAAIALAARLDEAGFTPYYGWCYGGLYEGDARHPGVFLDRHEDKKRIAVLRRPKVPSVIVETHHGRDREEHARWEEPATWDAFAAAIAAGLADIERGP